MWRDDWFILTCLSDTFLPITAVSLVFFLRKVVVPTKKVGGYTIANYEVPLSLRIVHHSLAVWFHFS